MGEFIAWVCRLGLVAGAGGFLLLWQEDPHELALSSAGVTKCSVRVLYMPTVYLIGERTPIEVLF